MTFRVKAYKVNLRSKWLSFSYSKYKCNDGHLVDTNLQKQNHWWKSKQFWYVDKIMFRLRFLKIRNMATDIDTGIAVKKLSNKKYNYLSCD